MKVLSQNSGIAMEMHDDVNLNQGQNSLNEVIEEKNYTD